MNKKSQHLFLIITIIFVAIFTLSISEAHSANVTLQWDANNPAPEGYRVFARLSGQSYNYNTPAWEGATATCTITGLSESTTYYFVVRAYEGENESGDSNEVSLFTDSTITNTAPVADAGSAQNVTEGDNVTLNGSGSTDSDNNIASYQWAQTGGVSAVLSDATSVTPTFSAPIVALGGDTLTFLLTVTDSDGLSDTSSCTVNVAKSQSTDSDGDNVADVLDAFPNDPTEWADNDNDGTGNNADTDDDNDGMTDSWETQYGLNPLVNDADLDLDGDGVSNKDEYDNGSDPSYVPSNYTPDKPVVSSPTVVGKVGLTPVLLTEAYFDYDNDAHLKTQWQISTESDFSSCVLDISSTSQLTSYTVTELVLDTDTTYYWRIKFFDSRNGESDWSESSTFTTIDAADSIDADGNGMPDDQELDVDVDIDNNGTLDSSQDNIMCVKTVQGSSIIGVKCTSNDTVLVSVKSIAYDTENYGVNNSAEMSLGLVGFKLYLNNGATSATVTVYFSDAAPAGSKWYKYAVDTGWQVYENAMFSDDGKSVTLILEDGGSGDEDGVANGVIVDPSGLGYPISVASTASDGGASAAGGGGGGCFISASNSASPSSSDRIGCFIAKQTTVLISILGLAASILLSINLAHKGRKNTKAGINKN